jgi:hypothetical protein
MLLNKNLEKIKKRELLILKKFDNFCKDNKIKYSLVPPEIGINLGCEHKTNKHFRGGLMVVF